MLIVSHRGNIAGPDPSEENTVKYLYAALAAGYNVEMDVRLIDGKFLLGHDRPIAEAPISLLTDPRSWVHAKNVEALEPLLKLGAHCFFHDSDAAVLTSLGWIWCFVGKPCSGSRSVCLLPEKGGYLPSGAICTDYCTNPHL